MGIVFEDVSFAFTNLIEIMDYYGTQEDVALFKLEKKSYSNIQSFVKNQKMIETSINHFISEIAVVNECQQLFESEKKIYEVLLTRGIIFKFEDEYELSFEKNIWFSEDITVRRGYKLINNFTPISEFKEG